MVEAIRGCGSSDLVHLCQLYVEIGSAVKHSKCESLTICSCLREVVIGVFDRPYVTIWHIIADIKQGVDDGEIGHSAHPFFGFGQRRSNHLSVPTPKVPPIAP